MKNLFFFALFSLFFTACNAEQEQKKQITSSYRPNEASLAVSLKSMERATAILESGKKVALIVARTPSQQIRGLSGVESKFFPKEYGMLFPYPTPQFLNFWMPNTYFNLDIFYLDEKLKVVDIERNLQAHPGETEPPPIARARSIFAMYALELRSDSLLTSGISKGQTIQIQYHSKK